MEIYEYGLIAAIPFFILMLFLFIAFLICVTYTKTFGDLIDFLVFNALSEMMKRKKDNNETLVYLRLGQDKVLLQNKTLKRTRFVLFAISILFGIYITLAFGQFAFIEYSYDCESGKNCFLWPFHNAFKADRADCSDPDIQQGKKFVVCYRMVLEPGFAAGVTFGMYKVWAFLVNIFVTFIGKHSKDRFMWCKISLAIFIAVNVLAEVYKSRGIMRISDTYFELIFTSCIAFVTIYVIVIGMPWDEIKAGEYATQSKVSVPEPRMNLRQHPEITQEFHSLREICVDT